MQLIKTIKHMRNFIKAQKRRGRSIGFVPTMGSLHQGHLSLMLQAKKDCDVCVVSIFVNPTQFGPKEDYKKYPRNFKRDERLAKSVGTDAVFYPATRQMYPDGYLTYVNVEKISAGLCGKSRPGHFKGVATIVTKLFNIVQPDIAYFGQKDAQQAVIISKMVKDLDMPLKIKVMPTVRESGGLAMSSRNAYLNPTERIEALVLSQSLKKARQMIRQGESSANKITSLMRKMILSINNTKIDYISCVDPKTLEPLSKIKGRVLIVLAARIGNVRLIDNAIINN